MKVAITGSRGFIGSHLKTRLEKDGHVVEVDFTDDGTIKGKGCGEEWERGSQRMSSTTK